ncbi:MAG: enoyl-CoA hydratase [Pseudomonadota bacterium]
MSKPSAVTTSVPILVAKSGAIGHLTINRPDKHNAMTLAMWRAVPDMISDLVEDRSVRVIVLAGAGRNAFCAGADIGEFDAVRSGPENAREYEAANEAAFTAVRTAAKPVIAAISGHCFGGGFGLAAACDIRLASEGSLFSVPASRLGLAYPVTAMADIVTGVGAARSKEMLFSARRYSAAEMHAFGFLNAVCETEQLEAQVNALCVDIASGAPLSIAAAKQSIAAVLSGGAEDLNQAKIAGDVTFASDDYAEGCVAFKEKRKPVFRGQ